VVGSSPRPHRRPVLGADRHVAAQIPEASRHEAVTARQLPKRHWRSYGDDPLPTGREALDEPFAAFPSWYLRITCDRCGKD